MDAFVATVHSSAQVPAPDLCRLVVVEGEHAGRNRLLTPGRHVVGRASSADLSIADPRLSRGHFELVVEGSRITLVDLGSSNGVRVNGVRLAYAVVEPGAIIRAGRVKFGLLPPEHAEDPTVRDRLAGLVGASRAMRVLYDRIERVAASDVTVLVTGESGTGKEEVAAALHGLSRRRTGPLVTCDLAALGGSTLESELFGHVRGAFTGAVHDTPGLLRGAHQGTLFLDEIGELSLEAQVKLLRAVERRAVRPVGALDMIPIDTRIVAASLRRLDRMVAERRFRLDLLHRLSVMTFTLPPLRERTEDLGLLGRELLARLDATRPWRLEDDALALLGAYRWPGNVRELRNVLQRVMARVERPIIDMQALVQFGGILGDAISPTTVTSFHVAKELVNDQWERAYVAQVMVRAGNNISRAASLAGIARTHLHRLLKKHRVPR